MPETIGTEARGSAYVIELPAGPPAVVQAVTATLAEDQGVENRDVVSVLLPGFTVAAKQDAILMSTERAAQIGTALIASVSQANECSMIETVMSAADQMSVVEINETKENRNNGN